MFSKQFGNVTISSVEAPKRGTCLEAKDENGTRILMDYCGMNPAQVPDGTNAYWFGNKLILVTRWSDMTDEEKDALVYGEMTLAAFPLDTMQFALHANGAWNDVMLTLPNCLPELNSNQKFVDKIIFIVADTHDSSYIESRCVELPDEIKKLFTGAMLFDYQNIKLDTGISTLRILAMQDPYKDEYDYIYDLVWEKIADSSRIARSIDLDKPNGGLYIKINSQNCITSAKQYTNS